MLFVDDREHGVEGGAISDCGWTTRSNRMEYFHKEYGIELKCCRWVAVREADVVLRK